MLCAHPCPCPGPAGPTCHPDDGHQCPPRQVPCPAPSFIIYETLTMPSLLSGTEEKQVQHCPSTQDLTGHNRDPAPSTGLGGVLALGLKGSLLSAHGGHRGGPAVGSHSPCPFPRKTWILTGMVLRAVPLHACPLESQPAPNNHCMGQRAQGWGWCCPAEGQ